MAKDPTTGKFDQDGQFSENTEIANKQPKPKPNSESEKQKPKKD